MSDEFKKNLSETRIGENNTFFGKFHSDITKEKIRKIAKLKIGDKNGMFGKHHSEDSRNKIKNARAGMI
jgi:hypothetical protein